MGVIQGDTRNLDNGSQNSPCEAYMPVKVPQQVVPVLAKGERHLVSSSCGGWIVQGALTQRWEQAEH